MKLLRLRRKVGIARKLLESRALAVLCRCVFIMLKKERKHTSLQNPFGAPLNKELEKNSERREKRRLCEFSVIRVEPIVVEKISVLSLYSV